ncbi:MAG TPA: zinc ribbon domain-containing protein [Thermoleophilaceae bacterium]|nr:zinc ribbon domain-containing protein [Thermoleophilaceae bacterium]
MRALRRLFDSTVQKATRSAAGSSQPAGLDPASRTGPTAHERTLMRRRARALHRQGGGGDELQAISAALAELRTLDELLAGGACVRCPACGELAGRRDRQCWSCGAQLAQPHEAATRVIPRGSRPGSAQVTGASSGRSPLPPAR